MGNVLRSRCHVAVVKCQHAALHRLGSITPVKTRASAAKVYRWLVSQAGSGPYISATIMEFSRAVGLCKEAVNSARAALVDVRLVETEFSNSRSGSYRYTLLNTKDDSALDWEQQPFPSYYQSPQALTHSAIYPQLNGTSVLAYEWLLASLNRNKEGKTVLPLSAGRVAKQFGITTKTLRGALVQLHEADFLRVGKHEIEILHPETGEPIPSGGATEEDEGRIYFFEPITGKKRLLNENVFNRDFYERYYRLSLHPDWIPGQNAHCVFHHPDRNPSLSVNVDDGVWYCHACGFGGGVLDFEKRVLDSDDAPAAWQSVARKTGLKLCPKSHGGITHRHKYRDAEGEVIYFVYRYEDGVARPFHPIMGRPRIGLGRVRRTLYNLPDVLAADVVLFVEGEKKADILSDLNILDSCEKPVAVTTTGGANSWEFGFVEHLKDKRVVVLPDSDEPGERYLNTVTASFRKASVEFETATFEQYGNDVRDFLKDHDTAQLLEHISCEWLITAAQYRAREAATVAALKEQERLEEERLAAELELARLEI